MLQDMTQCFSQAGLELISYNAFICTILFMKEEAGFFIKAKRVKNKDSPIHIGDRVRERARERVCV